MKKSVLILLMVLFVDLYPKQMSLDIDWTVFQNDNDNLLFEFYYSFPDTLLNYLISDGKYLGELYFNLKIESQSNLEKRVEWIATNSLDSLLHKHIMKMYGQKNILLHPGQYKAELYVKDLNDSTTTSLSSFNIYVRKYYKDRLDISDLEIANLIENQKETVNEWNRVFLKKDNYIIPNPSHEYFGNKPILFGFYEIYNAKTYAPSGLTIHYRILDGARREVLAISKSMNSDDNILSDKFNIAVDSLSTGIYYIKIDIQSNLENTDSVSIQKKFYIINSEKPPQFKTNFSENQQFERSEFSTLSDQNVEIEFQKAKYIASNDEIEQFALLGTTKAKQRFLFRFWKLRDPDSTSLVNKKYLEYQREIDYANTYFSFGKMKDGWRTERGRVLLKYGFPSKIDRNPAKENVRAWEDWFYEKISGGSHFYFVDIYGIGNYLLVHSTAMGEISDEGWQQKYLKLVDMDKQGNPATYDPNRK